MSAKRSPPEAEGFRLSVEQIAPMLLDERKQAPADESRYLSEIKYDGYRVLAEFGEGHCVLKTKNGATCSKWFPEVTASLSQLKCGHTIVDGEMVVLDTIGRTVFELLHERARRRRWREGDAHVTYCVFDLLVRDNVSIMDFPLVARKALLEELVAEFSPANVLYAKHVGVEDCENPVSWLYQHALALELEGVVGKLADSPYLPGQRSSAWFKLKRPGAIPPGRFRRNK